ncbi:hypothetical protein CFO_g5213 [Ceratocystis platani]|uniref:Uncharacterized protein n=1 Tax=Ceratocystis fimbriata f. sp. platani TaxID=88771 RepID=A0A0F8AZN2_CERFI|nr:hypothetical protein CFO_g5213 [Ceratocystis platani]
MVTHDATFDLALVFKDKSKSLLRTLTAAVIPDGAMPGDVTLGLSLHSKWEIQYCENYEVKLGGPFKEERGEKELSLMKLKKLGRSAATADDEPSVNVVELEEVAMFIKEFPELFAPTGRKVARVKNTAHRILTGQARPIKARASRFFVGVTPASMIRQL